MKRKINNFMPILCLLLLLACKKNIQPKLFEKYTDNAVFKIYTDSTSNINGQEFTKFTLDLGNDWKTLEGNFSIINDTLFYLNTLNETYPIACFTNNLVNNVKVTYVIRSNRSIHKSISKYYEVKVACKNNYHISELNDTIQKITLWGFRNFLEEDNVNLYLNKHKGILGVSTFIDSNIMYHYGGNIFNDTMLLLRKTGKVLM
jgi:hypothetical protein